jgi:hypothetical protein
MSGFGTLKHISLLIFIWIYKGIYLRVRWTVLLRKLFPVLHILLARIGTNVPGTTGTMSCGLKPINFLLFLVERNRKYTPGFNTMNFPIKYYHVFSE